MIELTLEEKELIMQALNLLFSHQSVRFSSVEAAEQTIAFVRSIEQKLAIPDPEKHKT